MMVTERVGGMMDRGFTSPATMPDYSAQWADYYRSLGMLKEAEIIEQQMSARTQITPAGPQPDYSAQWADYYRFVAPHPQPTYCHPSSGRWARSRKLRRLRPL